MLVSFTPDRAQVEARDLRARRGGVSGADARRAEHRLRPRAAALGSGDRPAAGGHAQGPDGRVPAADGSRDGSLGPGSVSAKGRGVPVRAGRARAHTRLRAGKKAADPALGGLRLDRARGGARPGVAGGVRRGPERPAVGGAERPLLRRLPGARRARPAVPLGRAHRHGDPQVDITGLAAGGAVDQGCLSRSAPAGTRSHSSPTTPEVSSSRAPTTSRPASTSCSSAAAASTCWPSSRRPRTTSRTRCEVSRCECAVTGSRSPTAAVTC